MSDISKFQGCTAISCVRQSVGKKSYFQYQIEEKCPYGDGVDGNNTCTYPKKEKKQLVEEANAKT